MTRFSLVLGVLAESGTCVQRAVSESPANQSASPVAEESRFGDSLVEVEWAWPKARASVSTSSGRSRASESETIVLRVDTARAWTESLGPQANACCSFFRSRCRWIVSAVRRQSAPEEAAAGVRLGT